MQLSKQSKFIIGAVILVGLGLVACGTTSDEQLAAQALVETKLAQTATAAVQTSTPTSTPTASPTVALIPTVSPTAVGGGGLIAFVSERDGNQEIYVINADGNGLTRLTSNPGDDYAPIWSPNTQQIAFVSKRPGGEMLFVMNSDSSGITKISETGISISSWSESGEMIYSRNRCLTSCGNPPCKRIPDGMSFPSQQALQKAYDTYNQCVRDHSDQISRSYDIYMISADGSREGDITNDPSVNFMDPSWSPDGEQLVVTGRVNTQLEIYIVEVNSSNKTRLTDNQAVDFFPAWSPDGERIAFVSDRDGNTEIYVMDKDGSDQTRLTDHPGEDNSPVWSPDGKKIAFVSGRDGNQEIYLMNADGSGLTRLTDDAAQDFSPTWSSIVSLTDIKALPSEISVGNVFSTEFEDIDSWYAFKIGPRLNDDFLVELKNDSLYIEVNEVDATVYAMYGLYYYQSDVRIEASVETVAGPNQNNFSLVCRATEEGWYEFSINSGGLWFIEKYVEGEGFITLAEGGSEEINRLKAKNEIVAVCEGRELTLYVNGVELGSVQDNQFIHGYFGVSVTTFGVSGVGVEFDSFSVSVP